MSKEHRGFKRVCIKDEKDGKKKVHNTHPVILPRYSYEPKQKAFFNCYNYFLRAALTGHGQSYDFLGKLIK